MNYNSPQTVEVNGASAIRFEDWTTLPLHFAMAIIRDTIPAMSSVKAAAEITYIDHHYDAPAFRYSTDSLQRAATDFDFALEAIATWRKHLSQYGFFLQFETDIDAIRAKQFHEHTQLTSAIVDSRTTIDSVSLWEVYDELVKFRITHAEYREDSKRALNYQQYANRLKPSHRRLGDLHTSSQRCIERALQQIHLNAGSWSRMKPIYVPPQEHSNHPLSVFISYSHADESFKDSLVDHLAALKHQGLIHDWHDRQIGGGNEWKDQIDENLENASIILLLISSDFLASSYCYDIEVKRAMEKHEDGSARVIPICLRPCDWKELPFGKLQGFPRDAKPITKWGNRDEAFTDIAKALRNVTKELFALHK
ncbi:MAG: toll/interleukin-1 receptor domain-containing protein [Planctomycetes bacterium]|nr:toll/interleukin-1 receptor domain-containing protein [Planctomycetota bacterium]